MILLEKKDAKFIRITWRGNGRSSRQVSLLYPLESTARDPIPGSLFCPFLFFMHLISCFFPQNDKLARDIEDTRRMLAQPAELSESAVIEDCVQHLVSHPPVLAAVVKRLHAVLTTVPANEEVLQLLAEIKALACGTV